MKSVGLDILVVKSDGNCLFHSIVLQIYGSFQPSDMVRQKCMDYILQGRDFFKHFIEEEKESIEQYTERKRRDGIWGDDIEL